MTTLEFISQNSIRFFSTNRVQNNLYNMKKRLLEVAYRKQIRRRLGFLQDFKGRSFKMFRRNIAKVHRPTPLPF